MSEDNDTLAKVREMAKLSLATNRISSVQEKNLKTFPFVFFNGVKSAKIEYDVRNDNPIEYELDPRNLDIKYKFGEPATGHFKITYHIDLDDSEDNHNMEKRYKHLEGAVRTLFWQDTIVEININGSLGYKSVKNVKS